MSDNYILDGKIAVKCDDILEWGRWFESQGKDGRRVARENVCGVDVSTVFLGIDHQWGVGPKLLFETMTFGPEPFNNECERCSTWEQAEAQHKAMVKKVKSHYGDTHAQ